MKLLVDEKISHRILPIIEEFYPGSDHVKNIGTAPVSDRFIWQYAQKHDYVIVTYDEDFYEWQQLKGYPPNIVWLRFGNAPTNDIAKKLLSHKDKIVKMAKSKGLGILEIQ